MDNNSLRLRRLGWAGIELEYQGETLLIDYIQDTTPLVQLRSPDEPFPASSKPGTATAALITHLHADHADPGAVSTALKPYANVFRPQAASGTDADRALTAHAEQEFLKYDLATTIIAPWHVQTVGPFKITSAPAVDGFGDPQVSWIVECGGKRIFHTGDTLFHGFWWRIANRFGPFDVVFLPVNGPVVDFPLLQPPSPLEAVMTPEEAAVAANILHAKDLVPIHYESLHKPPMYIETPNVLERLGRHLESSFTELAVKKPGDWFELGYQLNSLKQSVEINKDC